MWRKCWLVVWAILALGVIGCGGSQEGDEQGGADAPDAGRQQGGPAEAVAEFLEAVRTGDDRKAAMMLTSTAREKTAEMDLEVAPPGSDTASFGVGKVEYPSENVAHVNSSWSDLEENGTRRTDQIKWLLRSEPEGWRIAGVAAKVFQDKEPLLLNFEDPQEMLKKQRWLQEEARRRALQQDSQAQRPEKPEERALR